MSGQKKILISIPEALLLETDTFLSDAKMTRSEFIREAMSFYLNQKKRDKMHERMKKGYAEMGEINLEIAEGCLSADNAALKKYEEKLSECE